MASILIRDRKGEDTRQRAEGSWRGKQQRSHKAKECLDFPEAGTRKDSPRILDFGLLACRIMKE